MQSPQGDEEEPGKQTEPGDDAEPPGRFDYSEFTQLVDQT